MFIYLQLEAGGDAITVQRIFDDFEWLQHSLMTENDVGGIIVSTWDLETLDDIWLLSKLINHEVTEYKVFFIKTSTIVKLIVNLSKRYIVLIAIY